MALNTAKTSDTTDMVSTPAMIKLFRLVLQEYDDGSATRWVIRRTLSDNSV
jgi:hypothetical protein